jgi:hypothetical protein
MKPVRSATERLSALRLARLVEAVGDALGFVDVVVLMIGIVLTKR